MHEDHRKRVRERFLAEGLDNFAPHNILEFLLFYAIPQRDTNPIAHDLIEKFGSLSAVFDADIKELCDVKGIGEYSAVLIKMIPQLARAYTIDSQKPRSMYNDVDKLGKFFTTRFIGRSVETVFIAYFDSAYHLLDCELLCEGSVNAVQVNVRNIIEQAFKLRASMVAIAHNHPGGIAVPSSDDIQMTHRLKETFETVSIDLIDHYVISGEKYMPIMLSTSETLKQSILESAERRRFYKLPQ